MQTKLALLTAFSALAASLSAQTWSQAPALTTSPSMRRAGAMAFDGVGNRLIMYGGTSAGPATVLAETWSYNGQWSLLTPAQPAPPRWGHQLVRDTQRNRLVTFGGRSPTISGLANDTWIWTGSTWSALPTPASPTPRFRYGMCYDNLRDRVVLFGGRTTFATVNDTWEFDGITWAQRTLTTSPPQREDMVMTFDRGLGKTVVFGGLDNDIGLLRGDTWEYDGTTWRETTPAVSPTPRFRCAFCYDTTRQRIVVYGGYDGTQIQTQTYEYTGDEWRPITVGAGTQHASENYCAFDSAPARNRFVTFGGVGAFFSNETWEYQGAATAQFNQFGTGCPHSSGIATINDVTLPRIGQTFTMEIGNLPLSTAFVFTAQGFSSTTWNGNPLPFNLTSVGVTGCFLEVAADSLLGVVAANGSATFGFNVPNMPSLLNVSYFAQAFVPDTQAPNGFGGMSHPGRAIFGN